MNLLKMCGPQVRLCLLLFRPIAKQLNSYRYSQMTRWCKGNASALGATAPGFNSRIRHRNTKFSICFGKLIYLVFIYITFFIAGFVTDYTGIKIQT